MLHRPKKAVWTLLACRSAAQRWLENPGSFFRCQPGETNEPQANPRRTSIWRTARTQPQLRSKAESYGIAWELIEQDYEESELSSYTLYQLSEIYSEKYKIVSLVDAI